MSTARKPRTAIAEIEAWLAERHAGSATDLSPIDGGFWSSAFAYRVGEEEFVLRISEMREGFEIDAAAMRFAGPDLPVPAVLETGRAFGAWFAVSRRHYGRFVETVPEREADGVGKGLETLLAAMRSAPGSAGDPVAWYDADAPRSTWREWLLSGLSDDRARTVSGWRAKLASDPRVDASFRRAESEIRALLHACPERRDLVHGDLLHQNVLVDDDDAALVTGVFSWKCSVRGDFLFDVAWCTFWGDWHPAIAGGDLWRRTLSAPDLGQDDLTDAGERHHCYELQIGATHMGWNAWTGNDGELAAVVAAVERVLERGPLPASSSGSG